MSSSLRSLLQALAALALAAACSPAREAAIPPAPAMPPAAASSDMGAGARPPAQPPDPIPPDSDEGMWTYDNFPFERVQRRHGFRPDSAWLDRVRLSSVRLARGCSGSFVSGSGLVMTNHHCAHRCIEQLSSAKKDLVSTGFFARTQVDEARCPDVEVNQLVEIRDVTDRIAAETKGMSDQQFNQALKQAMSKLEKECASGDEVRCDVVTLYNGGRYHLYKYRRFQDVRLVFAPELAIAFFGGDPDNFMFPRYDLDVSFLRVYENGKPAATPDHLPWSPAGVKAGDLTFVSGHPWATSRLATVAELEVTRDVALPARLLRLAEARGVLAEFRKRGPEQRRIASSTMFSVENSVKALKGMRAALADPKLMATRAAAERELRARVQADPEMRAAWGGAWDAIAAAQARLREIRKPYSYLEQGSAFWSDLFDHARTLVRAGEELPKPNELRLREFAESRMPGVRQHLLSTAPIHAELEVLTLGLSLAQMREDLGADHPVVRRVLGLRSPAEAASALVKGTKLGDAKLRKALLEGGKAAVDASHDPMIELARQVDPDARAIRKQFEDEVEAVVKKNGELVAKARFAVWGTRVYPDATATLRISIGTVRGWEEAGAPVAPITTLGGAFERATGREPFVLPKSWIDAKGKLALDTPFDFCTSNDIIGGNSGSPVVDRNGHVVGVVFDGNIHSLGGDYAYEPSNNRAVAVHTAALGEALTKIYGARRIVDELRPAAPGK